MTLTVRQALAGGAALALLYLLTRKRSADAPDAPADGLFPGAPVMGGGGESAREVLGTRPQGLTGAPLVPDAQAGAVPVSTGFLGGGPLVALDEPRADLPLLGVPPAPAAPTAAVGTAPTAPVPYASRYASPPPGYSVSTAPTAPAPAPAPAPTAPAPAPTSPTFLRVGGYTIATGWGGGGYAVG